MTLVWNSLPPRRRCGIAARTATQTRRVDQAPILCNLYRVGSSNIQTCLSGNSAFKPAGSRS